MRTLPELNLTVICSAQNFPRKDFSGLECGLSKDLNIFVWRRKHLRVAKNYPRHHKLTAELIKRFSMSLFSNVLLL